MHGTPISAVKIPTGNCCGAIKVRAQVSASVRKLPPASTDTGSRTLAQLRHATKTAILLFDEAGQELWPKLSQCALDVATT